MIVIINYTGIFLYLENINHTITVYLLNVLRSLSIIFYTLNMLKAQEHFEFLHSRM